MADSLILPEIFDVADRERGEEISSQDLVDDLKAKKVDIAFAENSDAAST